MNNLLFLPPFQVFEELVDMASNLEGIDVKFFKATEKLESAFRSFQDGNRVDTDFFRWMRFLHKTAWEQNSVETRIHPMLNKPMVGFGFLFLWTFILPRDDMNSHICLFGFLFLQKQLPECGYFHERAQLWRNWTAESLRSHCSLE